MLTHRIGHALSSHVRISIAHIQMHIARASPAQSGWARFVLFQLVWGFFIVLAVLSVTDNLVDLLGFYTVLFIPGLMVFVYLDRTFWCEEEE